MLWRGMLPALYRHAIYTGIRMCTYEEIRDSLLRENKVGQKQKRLDQMTPINVFKSYFPFKDGFPLWKKVVAGMTAGGLGQLVASPTDLIKTQIQVYNIQLSVLS